MKKGFTILELLVSVAIVAVLAVLGFHLVIRGKMRSHQAVSTQNLRSLVLANLAYAADHGSYCPATERTNRVRWHGARDSSRAKFDPTKGFLAEYLGKSKQVGICPRFRDHMEGNDSFESGSGGYGYNAIYIGGTPADPFKPERPANVPNPTHTLMFATTALAKGKGLQEYPFAEPRMSVDPNGQLSYRLQPSVHFRFGGKALVAWCDGRVSAETMNESSSVNYYGGSNEDEAIGFCGPKEKNGWWNPRR